NVLARTAMAVETAKVRAVPAVRRINCQKRSHGSTEDKALLRTVFDRVAAFVDEDDVIDSEPTLQPMHVENDRPVGQADERPSGLIERAVGHEERGMTLELHSRKGILCGSRNGGKRDEDDGGGRRASSDLLEVVDASPLPGCEIYEEVYNRCDLSG